MPNEFYIDFKVRDYECDIQGIVNNAVYQNYLEHARHEYLLGKGLNFAQLAKDHINLVVVRVELDYKKPLFSGDTFYVTVAAERLSKLKFLIHQTIHKTKDQQLVLKGKTILTCINENGRPILPEMIDQLLS